MKFNVLFWPMQFVLLFAVPSCQKYNIVPDKAEGGCEIISSVEGVKIRNFYQDKQGVVWMNTRFWGVVKYDGQHLVKYSHDPSNQNSLSSNFINDIFEDDNGNMWLATMFGAERYDNETDSFISAEISGDSHYSTSLFSDKKGNLYLTTRRSIQKYDAASNSFEIVLDLPGLSAANPSAQFDSNGNFWLNSGKEVYLYDNSFSLAEVFSYDREVSNLLYDGEKVLFVISEDELSAIDVDSREKVELPNYLATLRGKNINSAYKVAENLILFVSSNSAYCYDVAGRHLHSSSDINNPYKPLLTYYQGLAFFYDKDGNFWYAPEEGGYRVIHSGSWIGKDYDILFNHLRGHYISDSAKRGRWLWILYDDRYLLTYDTVEKSIKADTDIFSLTGTQQLVSTIVLSSTGKMLLNQNSRSTYIIHTFVIDENGIPCLDCKYVSDEPLSATFDNEGNLWGSGRTPALKFAPKNSYGERVARFKDTGIRLPVNEMSYLYHIATLRDGTILLCHTDSNPMIFNPATGEVKVIQAFSEMVQVSYSQSFEDFKGNIWIVTSECGIIHYLREEDRVEFVETAGKSGLEGLMGTKDGSVLVLSRSNRLFEISSDAKSAVTLWNDERDFHPTERILNLSDEIVGLFSYDSAYYINYSVPRDNVDIDSTVKLILSSGRKVLSSTSLSKGKNKLIFKKVPENLNLSISIDDQYSGNLYEYELQALTSKVVLNGSIEGTSIPLFRLTGGNNRYLLTVKSLSDFKETPQYSLVLKVRHPLIYWLCLMIAAVGSATLLYFILMSRRRRSEIEKERREKQFQEEINRRNVDFFANMSHEFRAPLTLISGAVSEIESDSESKSQTLGIVKRNVDRMLKLVTQMLDFNKLDNGMLRLNVAETNISDIIRRSCEFFVVGASQKSIEFNLIGCDEDHKGYVDEDKLEKVMYNLCSNALKFTSPGGNITVSCGMDEAGNLNVSVSDTGIGLPEENTLSIFNRFTQSAAAKKAGGTGIGLSFSKSLIELHHGTITAANRYEGDDKHIAGALFSFSLPTVREAFSDQELEESKDTWQTIDKDVKRSEYIVDINDVKTDEKKFSVLLIDDDYEIVYYLKSLFSNDYNVFFRFDATSGYALIDKVHPDVIICDMMMMDVSGLELCEMIKNNLSMCHIPFIMLTGKSSVEDQVKSLNIGADAYVVKPFNPKYLIALVKSLIDNRAKIHNVLTSSVKTTEETSKMLGAIDKEFMDKLYETMESCLSESEVDFSEVASMMGVSRSKLFYKVKSLTGQTPNDFFNTFKLNKAADLIKEGKYKISAIASMVGFNSPSHFATLFKKKFGVLPSEYE